MCVFCFLDCVCFDGTLCYNYRGAHVAVVHFFDIN